MSIKKLGIIAAVVLCMGALACFAVATEPKASDTEAEAEAVVQLADPAMDEFAELYPNQYQSWTASYIMTFGSTAFGADFSHAALMSKIPAFCAGTGKSFTSSCLSCKSTTFNTVYADKGIKAYNQPIEDIEAEYTIEYFTCEACHADNDFETLAPNMVTFTTLAGDAVADIDVNTLICAQCHNSVGKYVYGLNENLTLENANPYRYGISYDGVYKAYLEDGQIPIDAATGAAVLTVAYTDFDTYYGSNHYNLGLTCVDCHMPQATAEDGTVYTNHNASSSPLENEDALARCLTCHKAQGVESAEAMVEFYNKAEAEFAAIMADETAAIASLKAALVEATEKGATGEGIDLARDCYSKAFFYNIYCTSYNHGSDLRIAHDPTGLPKLAQEIIDLCEQGLNALK
ncbi:MAG: ammonia-forming cytochrome c nitrite reductase subunit c552 [Coriobacteriales bacterium]|nr:ammonia-forming cytochrome c nitrite reductase subunit c552 [Coriobacteriales bacterium]